MASEWTWAAASQQGTAHKSCGEHRQDAFRVLAVRPHAIIAVVCDGAGSTSHGRYGAAIATRLISTMALAWVTVHDELPTPALIAEWVCQARGRIDLVASVYGLSAADFATTLILAASNGSSTVTAQIGDGAVVARYQASGEWADLSWPESGDFAATTFFLTDDLPRLRIGVTRNLPIDRLALFSDGLERLALDFSRRAVYEPFFAAMSQPVERSVRPGRSDDLSRKLALFLASESVNARTDDDKTFIMAAFQ